MTALLAFLLTLALECPVVMALSRQAFRQVIPFCLAMNGFTWGTAMALLSLYPVPHAPLEAGIALTEGLILTQLCAWSPPRALLAAVLSNVLSWQVGTFLLHWMVG